jgi:hypothetical protein
MIIPRMSISRFRKERGHQWTHYIYTTVFIRNAVNLAQLLPKPKPSRIRNGNENFKKWFKAFLGLLRVLYVFRTFKS